MRIVQFGDLHLDAPLERLSKNAAVRRRTLSRRLISDAVALAHRTSADMIICTGDLFDSETPYYDSVLAAAESFSKTSLPVFIAPGNHDPYTAASPYAAVEWSPNVHIFTSPLPETVELPFARVTGFANTEKRQGLRPLRNFRVKGGDLPEILVLHGELSASGDYFRIPPEDLSASGADYAALGHIHIHSVSRFGKCLAVMNGSAESRGFGEPGEKGAVVAEISPGASRAELVPLDGIRSICVSAEDGGKNEAELEKILRARCPWAPERTMLSAELTGRPHADASLLSERLSDFLCLRIIDRRSEPPELPRGRGLPALFYRRISELTAMENDPEKQKLLRSALEYGLSALENREQPRGSGK